MLITSTFTFFACMVLRFVMYIVKLGTIGIGYDMVWVRVGSRYELVRVRVGSENFGPSTNSETARNSAKSFIRRRCAKDLGTQCNRNEVNRTRNKKVINQRK